MCGAGVCSSVMVRLCAKAAARSIRPALGADRNSAASAERLSADETISTGFP